MILIIEDSDTCRMKLENQLREFYSSQKIESVATLKDAESKNLEDFDVVLLDHMLPDGTSVDFLQSVKIITPIIVLTGMSDLNDDLKSKVIDLGAFAFLNKTRDEFLPDLIDIAIRHKKKRQEIASEIYDLTKLIEELNA